MCAVQLERKDDHHAHVVPMTNRHEHQIRVFHLPSLESKEDSTPNLQPRAAPDMHENHHDFGANPGVMAEISSHGRFSSTAYTQLLPQLQTWQMKDACIPMRVSLTTNPFCQGELASCHRQEDFGGESRRWIAASTIPEPTATTPQGLVASILQTPHVMKQNVTRMPSPPPCPRHCETGCDENLTPPCARVLFPDF